MDYFAGYVDWRGFFSVHPAFVARFGTDTQRRRLGPVKFQVNFYVPGFCRYFIVFHGNGKVAEFKAAGNIRRCRGNKYFFADRHDGLIGFRNSAAFAVINI